MYLIGGHYRQPLAFSPSELEDAARRIDRIRDALRRVQAGVPSPPDMATHLQEFIAGAGQRLQHRRVRWRRCSSGCAKPTGASSRSATAICATMLDLLGLEDLEALRGVGDVEGSDPQAAALLAEREQARRDRDFQGADRLRDQINALGWEIRDGPQGPELFPAP